jgi:hypothetical protein
MKYVRTVIRMVENSDRSIQLLCKLAEARDNQSTAVNERLDKLIESLNNHSAAVNERLDNVIKRIEALTDKDEQSDRQLVQPGESRQRGDQSA